MALVAASRWLSFFRTAPRVNLYAQYDRSLAGPSFQLFAAACRRGLLVSTSDVGSVDSSGLSDGAGGKGRARVIEEEMLERVAVEGGADVWSVKTEDSRGDDDVARGTGSGTLREVTGGWKKIGGLPVD